MKKIAICTIVCLLAVCFMGARPVSQFSLFVAEHDLPLWGNVGAQAIQDAPERLDNVPLGEMPKGLKSCFDQLGPFSTHLLGENAANEPKMTWDDVERLTFTGPYYVFAQSKVMEKLAIDDFRQAFDSQPTLFYLIRLDGQPAGILHVKYSNGTYEHQLVSNYINANYLVKELDAVSSSEKLADDVFFLGMAMERFIVSKDDQVYSSISFGPNEVFSFTDLAIANYIQYQVHLEELAALDNGEPPRYGGGTNFPAYLRNPDEYLSKYNISLDGLNGGNPSYLWVWIASGIGLLFVAATLILTRKNKRKVA